MALACTSACWLLHLAGTVKPPPPFRITQQGNDVYLEVLSGWDAASASCTAAWRGQRLRLSGVQGDTHAVAATRIGVCGGGGCVGGGCRGFEAGGGSEVCVLLQ